MKKYKFAVILLVIIVTAAVSVKPFILFFAKRQIRNTFKGSAVSIGACIFKPASLIAFKNIEIKKEPDYQVRIKEAKIRYSIFSLLKLSILKAEIEGAVAGVNLGKKNTVDLIRQYLQEKAQERSLCKIKNAQVTNLRINLKSADLSLLATATLEVNPLKEIIHALELKVASLGYRGLNLRDLDLTARQAPAEGRFYINELSYNKLKIREIQGSAELKDKILFLNSLSARLLDGSVSGSSFLRLEGDLSYNFKLNFLNLDLERYVKDSEMEEKLTLTGRLSGALLIEGKGAEFKVIAGNLYTLAGGTLAIKDAKSLENLSRRSGQSLGLLVEGFRDYHYNVGIMELSLDKGDLVCEVNLEGEKGKRDLTAVWHNFKWGREGL